MELIGFHYGYHRLLFSSQFSVEWARNNIQLARLSASHFLIWFVFMRTLKWRSAGAHIHLRHVCFRSDSVATRKVFRRLSLSDASNIWTILSIWKVGLLIFPPKMLFFINKDFPTASSFSFKQRRKLYWPPRDGLTVNVQVREEKRISW